MDTRTKNIVAKDRLIVAEQRTLDIERRKSATILQLIAFEQKQLEKRSSSIHRHRSISEAHLHRTRSWNEISDISHSTSYHQNNNQNVLFLPKGDNFQERIARCSDEYLSDKFNAVCDPEYSDEENGKSINARSLLAPVIAITPPEK